MAQEDAKKPLDIRLSQKRKSSAQPLSLVIILIKHIQQTKKETFVVGSIPTYSAKNLNGSSVGRVKLYKCLVFYTFRISSVGRAPGC